MGIYAYTFVSVKIRGNENILGRTGLNGRPFTFFGC